MRTQLFAEPENGGIRTSVLTLGMLLTANICWGPCACTPALVAFTDGTLPLSQMCTAFLSSVQAGAWGFTIV